MHDDGRICQAIESWWSVNSTEESRSYSQNLEMIVGNGAYFGDRMRLQRVMLVRICRTAINIAKTTAAHAMSYKITSMYGLPMTHAVAICLPKVWVT